VVAEQDIPFAIPVWEEERVYRDLVGKRDRRRGTLKT